LGYGGILNHDCLANAYASFMGDIMIVRAGRSIAEGQEVTLSYCNAALPWDARQKKLQSTWKFSCQCQRCRAEQDALGDSDKQDVLRSFRPESRPSASQTVLGLDTIALRILIDSVERDLRAVKGGKSPNIMKEAQLLLCLIQLFALQREPIKVQELACQLLAAHNHQIRICDSDVIVEIDQPIVTVTCLEAVSHLLHAYRRANPERDGWCLEDYAKTLCEILFGSESAFRSIYLEVGCFWQVP
jgi:hypothetical protein